jgi:hypothetical protein
MRLASAGALRPAAFTTVAASSWVPSSATSAIPSEPACADSMPELKATSPPAFSRSPCSASMSAWLSTMPVLGEWMAATHASCGSIARFIATQQHQIGHPVGGGLGNDALQCSHLRV